MAKSKGKNPFQVGLMAFNSKYSDRGIIPFISICIGDPNSKEFKDIKKVLFHIAYVKHPRIASNKWNDQKMDENAMCARTNKTNKTANKKNIMKNNNRRAL